MVNAKYRYEIIIRFNDEMAFRDAHDGSVTGRRDDDFRYANGVARLTINNDPYKGNMSSYEPHGNIGRAFSERRLDIALVQGLRKRLVNIAHVEVKELRSMDRGHLRIIKRADLEGALSEIPMQADMAEEPEE